MRRLGTLSIVCVLLITGIAVAASVHFKPRGPVFRDNGTTLNATGTLAGLGNEDVTITLQAEGTASTVGYNQGGNAAPGQNVGISATATTTISASEIQNGQLFISLTTPRGCARRGTPTGRHVRQADASRRRNGPRKATSCRLITVRLRSKSCLDGRYRVSRVGRRAVVAHLYGQPAPGGAHAVLPGFHLPLWRSSSNFIFESGFSTGFGGAQP
jgi:hypothetical protein